MTEPAKLPEPQSGPDPEDEVRLTFMQHLEELRKRLLHAAIGVVLCAAIMGVYAEKIFRWLMDPVIASLPEGQRALHYTNYLEPFFVYFKVAMYGGIFLGAPWLLWQIWQFVAPGLYRHEKKLIFPFLGAGTACFYGGALFCRELVMPYAFPALAGIAGPDMTPILTMQEQLGLVLGMLLGFGIIFELPVVIAVLAMLGLVSAAWLAKYRRHAIVVNVALAAIITPTGDPFNLAMMALPMVVFYEVGIILARILGKKRAEDQASAA